MYGTSFYGASLLGLRAEDIKWAVFRQECTYIFFERKFRTLLQIIFNLFYFAYSLAMKAR